MSDVAKYANKNEVEKKQTADKRDILVSLEALI